MPSRASRQFNELVNGERTGNATGSVPKSMRARYSNILEEPTSPETQKVIDETKNQLPDTLSSMANTQVFEIKPRHETYERGDKPQRSVVSDETLYDKPLTSITEAPTMLLPLADIPDHIHFPMDQDKKDRFYPDGYAKHYFNEVERFTFADGTKGKVHGQLFVHKTGLEDQFYYYIVEVNDATSSKKLYDDKVFYLVSAEQFEVLGAKKS